MKTIVRLFLVGLALADFGNGGAPPTRGRVLAIGIDGTIYFGAFGGKFYAVNLDGGKRWEFRTGANIFSAAAIDADGVIYFGSQDGQFYALNPNGTLRWSFVTGGAISASPALG